MNIIGKMSIFFIILFYQEYIATIFLLKIHEILVQEKFLKVYRRILFIFKFIRGGDFLTAINAAIIR